MLARGIMVEGTIKSNLLSSSCRVVVFFVELLNNSWSQEICTPRKGLNYPNKLTSYIWNNSEHTTKYLVRLAKTRGKWQTQERTWYFKHYTLHSLITLQGDNAVPLIWKCNAILLQTTYNTCRKQTAEEKYRRLRSKFTFLWPKSIDNRCQVRLYD